MNISKSSVQDSEIEENILTSLANIEMVLTRDVHIYPAVSIE